MRTPYHKLIRDHIPAIIQERGGACGIERLDEAAYRQAVREKLVEEAREVAGAMDVADGAAESAGAGALLTELADLFEVVDAVLGAHGLTHEQVRAAQAQRRAERGGFTQRLRLLWTE